MRDFRRSEITVSRVANTATSVAGSSCAACRSFQEELGIATHGSRHIAQQDEAGPTRRSVAIGKGDIIVAAMGETRRTRRNRAHGPA